MTGQTVPVAVSVEPEFVVGAGLLLAAPPAVWQQHVVVEPLGSEHAVQAAAVDAVLHHKLPQPHAAALQSEMHCAILKMLKKNNFMLHRLQLFYTFTTIFMAAKYSFTPNVMDLDKKFDFAS